MENRLPPKADSSSANQILGILLNSMFQYRLRSIPSPDTILSQLNPVPVHPHRLFL